MLILLHVGQPNTSVLHTSRRTPKIPSSKRSLRSSLCVLSSLTANDAKKSSARKRSLIGRESEALFLSTCTAQPNWFYNSNCVRKRPVRNNKRLFMCVLFIYSNLSIGLEKSQVILILQNQKIFVVTSYHQFPKDVTSK